MGKLTTGWTRGTLPLLLVAIMLATALPLPDVARAATLTVPCTGGVGNLSALISAIGTANGNGQDDTIQLGVGCVYTITAPHNTTGGDNGLPTIQPDSGRTRLVRSLTIVGNGATIRRGPSAKPFRIFYINGGNLTLRGLTLSGGLAVGGSGQDRSGGRTGGFGGAIYNAGQLTLDAVTITASEARGGDGASRTARDSGGGGGGGAGLGGAIFNASGAGLSVVSSTLSGNTARGGNGGAGGNNGTSYGGGGGGGNGGTGGGNPSSSTQPGKPGDAAPGLGGGGGGGGGSNGSAASSFAPSSPRAGAGGAGSFGGGGGGAGAGRIGGSGNIGGAGGFGAGAGGTSCCSYAGGGGGGAGLGGAIFNNGGTVGITSSTIFGNLGLGGAGGAGSFGFGNGAPGTGQGGALFTRGGALSYTSALIAGNGAADCTSDGGGLTSGGYNLLTPTGGCASATSDRLAADPGLLPLANNGGSSFTHALAEGSPAIDAGGPACPAADQRGVARPQGAACDSGAFELVPAVVDLVVTTSADAGAGSLRQAILDANARTGPDTISFNIAGSPIISPTTALPTVSGPTLIDGLTQPGATALAPTVTLDGSLLTDQSAGLTLAGGATTVRGLIITGFGGAGISVVGGMGNSLGGNRIFGNGGPAIDLGGDGSTPNDPGDGDAGANNLLNAPVVAASEGATAVQLTATLDVPPGAYTIELYASAQCDLVDNGEGVSPRLSGPGEGETFLVAGAVTVATAGSVQVSLAQQSLTLADRWFSALVIDAAGNTSEFSDCAPVQTNDLWTNARPLELLPTDTANVTAAEVGQGINRPFQERWYRFPVGPGGRVTVRLDGQPGSILTLHRDLEWVYRQLSLPRSAAAVAANEQTAGFLPGAYLPGAYLPGAYLPGAYLPGAYLPGAYLPGAYLPGAYLPGAYLPGAYLPGAYLPGAYLPGAYLPGAYLPEQYSAAARASLIAYAADPDADTLSIERNTWDLAENLYVRVVAPAGTSFNLAVSFTGNFCSAVQAPAAGLPVVAPAPLSPADFTPPFSTLLLYDSARAPAGDQTALLAALTAFADRGEVNGLLIDLGQQASGGPRFPRVAAARATLDAFPSCAAAANLLANEIKAVVDAYRTVNQAGAGQTSLSSIVLVGGDEAIPFFRYPDVAGIANENEYFPPVEDNSPANAALREGRVSGQDAYGSTVFISRGIYDLPVPDLAVGRLVGDAATVGGLLAAYSGVGGQVNPGSALVTGYDFVADGAEAIYSDLQAGLGAAPARLIQPEGQGPDGPDAWSADDLRAALLNPAVRNDLVFFTGHFAAGSALAADYETSLLAGEIAASGANFTNSILFGLGCHSGFNVPPPDALDGFSPEPDWPEAWARAGATYIAATGFAYGDTELVEYGERLLLNLSQALRTGSEPVAIGQALVRAKQDYLAQKAALSGIDEKTLLQFTLYGLPMLRVNLPGKLPAAGEAQLVNGLAPVAEGTPGAAYGLQLGTSGGSPLVSVSTSPARQTVPLIDTDGSPVEGVYYTGPGGAVVANPTEPIFPLVRGEVDLSDPAGGPQILRGVGFRGGSFSDVAGLALTSAPATENGRGHLKFLSDTFYPSQPWSANYFEALRDGPARLFAVPAQYRATPEGGTFRVFSRMDFRLYYLDGDWPGSAQRAAGLAAAPEIVGAENVRLTNGNAAFRAFVVDGAALGVQEVWITYSVPGSGAWQSVDLTQDQDDPSLWRGPSEGVAVPPGTRYMVQAAGAAGKVSLDTNDGAYYEVDPPLPPSETRGTSLVAQSFPTSGAYGERASFSVRLTDDRDPPQALGGRSVRLFLGGQVAFATTDAGGLATFTIDLAQAPGVYPVQAIYGGEPGYGRSRVEGSFTIVPAATRLSIEPAGPLTVVAGRTTGIVATLRAGDPEAETGGPLADATVIFVGVRADGQRFGAAVKTNLDGRAVLGAVGWPAGSYSVTAYYSGNGVPVTGGPASPTIPYLASQSGAVGLTIISRALCYADGAQQVHYFQQGLRHNGTPVEANRSDPTKALGLPQNDDTLNFVALGFDGALYLEFANPIVNDGTSAPEIRVWETSFGDAGRPWSDYPEAVQVVASADGESWTLIGTTSGKDQAYDLVLPSARYLGFIDVSDSRRFSGTDDGFDLDAVEVLSGCAPPAGGGRSE